MISLAAAQRAVHLVSGFVADRIGSDPAEVRSNAGAHEAFTGRQRLLLLLGFALVVALRLPNAWVHGRFLDEEGTIFFAFAWHRPAFEALWRSFGGYLNLGANATTLLTSRMVRWDVLALEVAPYLTMLLALLVQMMPAALILTGRGSWLSRKGAIVAALLVIAVSPKTEEVFLNVLHIQFHLALGTGLVLALAIPRSRVAQAAYAVILFLAPLCGPGAIVLLPFFVLRSLVDREPARMVQTIAFAAGAAAQLIFFFVPSPVRGDFLDPATLMAILFVRLAALPFLTSSVARWLGRAIHGSYTGGGFGWWFAAAGGLAYFAGLTLLALCRRRDAAIWFVMPGLALAAASFGGGMINSSTYDWFSAGAGQRYNFLPIVLISLGLIVMACRPDGRYRKLCAALCALTLVSGAASYIKPIRELRNGPVWPDEVAAWRRDHDHPLKSWPADWTIDLSDRSRPCAPPRLGVATSDPSYCESHWLDRVVRARIRAEQRGAARTAASHAPILP